MSLPALTLIPAGAGSGKTHSIQERLGAWVAAGAVAPERIVAVTFTEAAAAELRQRIGGKLLDLGRLEEALRLDQAYISTIHGFGLRLLTEFAFESGTSPQPRLLNDDEQSALIRLALARTDRTDAITADLTAYGYVYDHGSGQSAEDGFRDDVLRVVELLRTLGWRAHDEGYARAAVAWITERHGPTADGASLGRTLRARVEALLREYPESLEREHGKSKAGTTDLQRDFRNLRAALEDGALDRDWKLWQSLRNLRQSVRGAALPARYDDLTSDVMTAAHALPRHPGPLAHACRHVEALLAAGQDVLVHYAAAKREAGLVDYVDMIAKAGQLLRDRPEVLKTLVQRIDCLVVDEFQDTNPLQFSLLWQLATAGVPTIVVGDLKQAIMGFQGADPRLFEALQTQQAAACQPLTRNWRSQPDLMAFVNALGPGLFGDAYVPLTPQRQVAEPVPLEVVSFRAKAKKGHHAVRAVAIGARLRALLDDPRQRVVDRRTDERRRPRGSDIAVLCPTNDMLAIYADVLRALGLRVRLQADGWAASRAVQLVRQALAYIGNPADRHAALYLAVTELGCLTLKEALQQLMDGGRVQEPLLERLDALAAGVAERTVYVLVADTIAALGLFDAVARWPDGEQARANLLRLLAEAGEFMDSNREALASGGYHGSGVQTFLAWLSAKVTEKDGDRQPEPRVLDEDAIVLTTWHRSKGSEWPVTAVCGLDREVNARLPDLALGYRGFEDLSALLAEARIEYAPKFAAPEICERFLAELQTLEETEARRCLYVALTRARDKLILEWPGYLAGKDTTTSWSLLTGDCRMALDKNVLKVGSEGFPCAVTEGAAEWPEELELGKEPEVLELPRIGRRAIRPGAPPALCTPDSRTASGRMVEGEVTELAGLAVARYGERLELNLPLTGTSLGSLLHRCFEILGGRPDLAAKIPKITGVAISPEALKQVAAAAERFEHWIKARFDVQSVRREWPLLAIDEVGSIVSGTADLIVVTREGAWVIDHKSDVINDPLQSFSRYESQLEAYASAIAAEGQPVAGLAIHWVRRGEVVMKEVRPSLPVTIRP